MIVITSSTVLFCQLLFALWVYSKLYSLVNITWMWFYVAQRKNNIAREWPVQKLTFSFGGIPQFLSECTALGRCFFGLATGNMLPHVNLTLLERIGVNRVGYLKT